MNRHIHDKLRKKLLGIGPQAHQTCKAEGTRCGDNAQPLEMHIAVIGAAQRTRPALLFAGEQAVSQCRVKIILRRAVHCLAVGGRRLQQVLQLENLG